MPLTECKTMPAYKQISEYATLLQERVPYGDLSGEANVNKTILENQKQLDELLGKLLDQVKVTQKELLAHGMVGNTKVSVNEANLVFIDMENALKLGRSFDMLKSRTAFDWFKVTQRANNYVRFET